MPKTNWKDIGDLRLPNPRWRLGRAAAWYEQRLGLPAGAVMFVRPDGTKVPEDETLGALRNEWLTLAARQRRRVVTPMSNSFGIPADVEQRIRARDTRCVYCGKNFSSNSHKDRPTIEHLNQNPPFYWEQGLKEEGLAICCGSCNSSRSDWSLEDWFQTPYCRERKINADTVAPPVKRYLRSRK